MVGLSSQNAQYNLHLELQNFATSCRKINWFSEFLHSPYVPISSASTCVAGLILLADFAAELKHVTTLLQSIVLFTFTLLNLLLFVWEIYILKTRRIRWLLSQVKPFIISPCPWGVSSYPKMPISTLRGHFTVQTFRDGVLVNLPTSLLVQGDVIELRNDTPSPAKVTLLPSSDDNSVSMDTSQTTVRLGDTPPSRLYPRPQSHGDMDTFQFAQNVALPQFVVTETPIISLLKCNVIKQRPKTVLTRERNRLLIVMDTLVGVVFVVSLAYNFIRYFSLTSDFDDSWRELLLRQPVYTALPIMLVPLPLLWGVFNMYGTALLTLLVEDEGRFSSFRKRSWKENLKNLGCLVYRMCSLPWNSSTHPNYRAFHILGSLTSVCAIDKEYLLTTGYPTPEKTFFLRTEDITGGGCDRAAYTDGEGTIHAGSSGELCEGESDSTVTKEKYLQSNSLQVLITLEDSDEEINHKTSQDSSKLSEYPSTLGSETIMKVSSSSSVVQSLHSDSLNVLAGDSGSSASQISEFTPMEVMKEILDISSTEETASGVCFDDSSWHVFISSLKPIGVNLLSTSHLFEESCNWCPLGVLPDLNRLIKQTSCTCSLGVEIGVSEYSSSNLKKNMLVYSFSDTVCTLHHSQTSKAHSAVSIGSSSVQPHMITLVLEDSGSSNRVLMTRGSGEMVASCCTDFWNGKDLQPLTELEHTTIMDFCNRRSIAGYCVALAYNPLLAEVNLSSLKDENVGLYVPHLQIDQSFRELNLSSTVDTPLNAAQVFSLLQCNQVFLGLLSLQFKPKTDVVTLIEDLQVAGIRFVHFTFENQKRGKVFAQTLGLEADWNCHISLAQDLGHEDSDSEDDTSVSHSSSMSSLNSYIYPKTSNFTAKLPVGIDNVRPHIENVDNVPLQVPLFTDCSVDSIREMIRIMQENSEVVLCLGNAWNRDNLSIYSQADISLSLIPSYNECYSCFEAETCALSTSTSSQATGLTSRQEQVWPSPMQMAAVLNSTTSQLCFSREHNISLLHLIAESRHILSVIRHGLLFGMGCCLSVALLMLAAELFFLPPPLSGNHIFWFIFFVIPLLSTSFLSISINPRIKSQLPTRKKQILSERYLFFFNFLLLFVPTVGLCVLLFGLTLTSICFHGIPDSDCHLLLGNRNSSSSSQWNGWRGDNEQGLILSQDITAFFLFVYFLTLSLRFIHRTKPLWRLWKLLSWQFVFVMVSLFILQIIYFVISQVHAINIQGLTIISGLWSVPVYVWVIGFLWPFLLILLQELLKRRDKMMLFKMQTHLKLEFETRLGMYSPM